MLSRFAISVIVFSSLLGFVHAAVEETDKLRIGNETIDRTTLRRRHKICDFAIGFAFRHKISPRLLRILIYYDSDCATTHPFNICALHRPRLTKSGWLWSRLALTAVNFVVEVEFKISGDSSHLFGDGLAIWLTRERKIEGPVFGNKDNFEGLGIFLDTNEMVAIPRYANGRHSYSFPRITAMLGDGKMSYDQANDGDANSIGACSANFRRTNIATKLKITYIKSKFLDTPTLTAYVIGDEWTDCFHVKNISLPTNPFLGFSAMTGDVSDAHDIVTVTTYSAILIPPEPTKQKKGIFSSSSSYAGICTGGYYGYQEYQKRQRGYGGGTFGLGGIGRGGGGGYGGFGGGSYSGNKRAF
ncbi:hypothetical protein C0995_009201 [Termitomyces sp. Mi166|nr:hypothetical protein C0995_009201 [Termitomyces sp. Mi166\